MQFGSLSAVFFLTDQFHTPVNLALALSGECGEVCEIFQWKGPVESINDTRFSEKELVNIGEE